jgi:hypothetical protein
MTTKQAFDKLIFERNVHKKLDMTSSQIRNYRFEIRNKGKYPSTDLMIELLKRAGFKVLREMEWEATN